MTRRLVEYCDSFHYKLSLNSTGDQCVSPEKCGKPLQVVFEAPDMFEGEYTGYTYQILKCGHTRTIPTEKKVSHSDRNIMWDRLLPFQKEFVEHAEQANLRILNTCEMGLGKTPMALSVVRENAVEFTDNFTKLCIIIVPVGGIYQWEEEAREWFGLNHKITSLEHIQLTPQVVVTNGQLLSPLSKVVIVPWSKISDKRFMDQVKALGIASLIVDECHFFKDPNSNRTKAMQELSKLAGPKAPKLFLSGTVIENRVMELRVVLNQLDPNYFYSWEVLDRMCLHAENKTLSLAPYWRDKFFDRVKPYWYGKKKSEVNIPMPEIEYHTEWTDPFQYDVNSDVVKAYNITLEELAQALEGGNRDAASIIGLMQQLRHHVGRMKIMAAAMWADEFMTMFPNEKLCIGIHHIFVREALAKLLAHRNPLQMSSEDPKVKDEIERAFKNGQSNLLIANIGSAGVGRNFQFCRNALILERQWNRSKEDQFAQRFWRIMKDENGRVRDHFTVNDTVHITTMNLRQSLDVFMDSMGELKEIICDSTDESVDDIPPEDSIIELARKVVLNRMRYVGA
jgi:hypothetical protein